MARRPRRGCCETHLQTPLWACIFRRSAVLLRPGKRRRATLMTLRLHRHISAAFTLATLLLVAIASMAAPNKTMEPTSSPQDVLTYHGDNLRTGWFSSETVLTAENVNAQSFGTLEIVPLDGRVDAEPLVVMQQAITGHGVHDVVYVATENKSVYALDANDGSNLWQRHYASPVPYQYKNNDDNVFPVMGILGTPVIDRSAGAIYFVADHYNGTEDAFYLHAVSLSDGRNLLKPALIHFSEQLPSGGKWAFNPKFHLQRPGLLEVNGYIYVAFGSNGDTQPDQSRGTILRYDAATLTQLSGQITNKRNHPASPYYLSSIWQSGYAPAADANGDIYFSTGNSDPKNPSYDPTLNRPDSMVHLSGDLSTLIDSFTTYNYFRLDRSDTDVGSGGMLLLPDQFGLITQLAVAGGKDGRAFLMDRNNLGGYTEDGPDKVLQTINMGPCWCGPAYFVGSDGRPYVITGGGNGIASWQLQTAPSIRLVPQTTTGSVPVRGLPDNGGSIPVVSSNGTTAGSGVVWFVQRPATSADQDPGTPVTLLAYAASDLTQQLVSLQAGTWTHAVNSNANIVPTVANGKVYVASNKQLRIFGLFSKKAHAAVVPHFLSPSPPTVISCGPAQTPLAAAGGSHTFAREFYGTICRVNGNELQLALPSGRSIVLDTSDAFAQNRRILRTPGRPVQVRATIDAKGRAHAQNTAPSHLLSAVPQAHR